MGECDCRRDMMLGAGLVLFLVAVCVFTVYISAPPAPVPASAPETAFSAERAHDYDRMLASVMHTTGTRENVKTRDYILETLKKFGIEAEISTHQYVHGNSAGEISNVIARIPGTTPGKSFALMAHYDSVPYGPGAADDCGGVSVMLETARALTKSPRLLNDIVFVFTNGEEDGTVGAEEFTHHEWFKNIGVFLNLEARGTQGPSLMFETSDRNGWLIRELAQAGVAARANSAMYDIYKRLPFNSDFTKWKRAGANGFNAAFVDNFAYYHTRNDNPDNISLASLQNHGSYALGLARHLGSIPLDNVTAPDVLYFNVGSKLFHYPMTWGMPLALASALLFAIVLVIGFVRRHLTVGGLIAGTVLFPLALIAAMLVTVAGAAIAYGPRVLMRFYTVSITHLPDLQVLYNNNLFGLAFAVMAVGVAALVYTLAAKKIRVQNLAAGALIWWVVLLGVILALLPGGSYIPMWTLFFSSLGLGLLFLARDPEQLPAPRVAFAALFAVPGIVLTIPVFQMALSTLMVMAAPALVVFPVLVFGLVVPQAEVAGRANRAWFPALAIAAGLLLFVTAVATDGVSAKRPKLDNLCYAMDYDTGKACWFSDDPAPDEWTSQFFKAGTPRAAMDDFMPWEKNKYLEYLKAEAPAAPYAGPVVSVVGDVVRDTREITLHVASDEPGKRVELRFEGPEVLAASVFGQEMKMDRDRSRINLRLFPAGGVDVSLKVAPNAPLIVVASEELCGLPQFPGMKPRPPHIICMPNTVQHGRSFSSDHVYLKHTFTFPPPRM